MSPLVYCSGTRDQGGVGLQPLVDHFVAPVIHYNFGAVNNWLQYSSHMEAGIGMSKKSLACEILSTCQVEG